MVLVAVLVVGVAGFAIYRLHGIFGSHYNTSANAACPTRSSRSTPSRWSSRSSGRRARRRPSTTWTSTLSRSIVKDAPLPWSFTITTTEPAVVGNVVAQGNGDTLGCRIIVNGEVKDERTVNKVDAYTFCLDKSG